MCFFLDGASVFIPFSKCLFSKGLGVLAYF